MTCRQPLFASRLDPEHYQAIRAYAAKQPENTLREIKGYVSHEKADLVHYTITGAEDTLNEAIFDFAVSKNLKILEMTTQHESVEDIFQKLTQPS